MFEAHEYFGSKSTFGTMQRHRRFVQLRTSVVTNMRFSNELQRPQESTGIFQGIQKFEVENDFVLLKLYDLSCQNLNVTFPRNLPLRQ